jgi:protein ImuA
LGARGLDPEAVHEVKPATGSAGACAAALAFTLRLAARRLKHIQASSRRMARILWCWPERWRYEMGHLYGAGLERLGLDPRALLIVETARKADALWALEEGLKSASLALAVGVLDDVALTPARRLALAAAEGATPCLLLTSARAAATGATATRWRIGPAPGAPHPFDGKAPGNARSHVALERSRGTKPGPETSHMLEWSDETHCFRMAADVAHRAPLPALTRCRTG